MLLHPVFVEHAVRFECRRASARDTSPPLVSHSFGSTVSLQLNIILNFLGSKLVVEESVADTQNVEERCNLFP